MPVCSDCHEEKPEVGIVSESGRCDDCMRKMFQRAMSNFMLAMSEEVVKTEFGWCTAQCAYQDPIKWLCLHIHNTEEEARACLDERLSVGRGSAPST